MQGGRKTSRDGKWEFLLLTWCRWEPNKTPTLHQSKNHYLWLNYTLNDIFLWVSLKAKSNINSVFCFHFSVSAYLLIKPEQDRMLCQDKFELQTWNVFSKVIPSTAAVVINHVSIWAEWEAAASVTLLWPSPNLNTASCFIHPEGPVR